MAAPRPLQAGKTSAGTQRNTASSPLSGKGASGGGKGVSVLVRGHGSSGGGHGVVEADGDGESERAGRDPVGPADRADVPAVPQDATASAASVTARARVPTRAEPPRARHIPKADSSVIRQRIGGH
ncbi:hypothetical protein GCM10023074_16890 [Microbispora amethystogenes]|uniref:Uncharacterized protein n=1 Tax=Microbispora amethystogenes TaxID=1427754 RepID=A0ABQ4F746_9ACTN|nr:hypothetical protein Mam01_07520 [Microbispora amethystogenes]